MEKVVKIYNINSANASENMEKLLTPLYFYWDIKSFETDEVGSEVFFVCERKKKAFFAIKENQIPSVYNSDSNFTSFTDSGSEYRPVGKWGDFVRFKIIATATIPDGWEFKDRLGNQNPIYYLYKSISKLNDTEKRIQKLDDLKKIFIDEITTTNRINELIQSLEEGNKNKKMPKKEKQIKTPNSIPIKIIPAFVKHLKSQGLIYDDRLVKRFIASLATKPFVILTGNSGSGKSRIALEFAKWMNSNNKDKYALVPVGADWTDNRSVLGYFNPLSNPETYVSTPILNLILRAEKDEKLPYFLILDEMNLSHVERYFSDFLSLMESSEEPIRLHNAKGSVKATGNDSLDIPAQIKKLPENLFVIGTVNIDETTYMFSPKVLDRANVIEIKTLKSDLEKIATNSSSKGTANAVTPNQIEEFIVTSRLSRNLNTTTTWQHQIAEIQVKDIRDLILKYFVAMEKHYLEFGFRTMKEALSYAKVCKELTTGTPHEIKDETKFNSEVIDEQCIQKFITKLNGSKMKMDLLLKKLLEISCGKPWPKDNQGLPDYETLIEKSASLSAIKLLQMIKRVNQDQFVSFI